jgi:hypothetical protein
MKKFPDVIYVNQDDGLLAWPDLKSANDGKVAIYRLEEKLEKRTVPEIRRKGSRRWFR